MKKEPDLKELYIDFDRYTDGDADFKRELITLIVADLQELHRCIVNAFKLNDPAILHKGCHKAGTTLEMVNDPELKILIAELKEKMEGAKANNSVVSRAEEPPIYRFLNELAKSIAHLNE